MLLVCIRKCKVDVTESGFAGRHIRGIQQEYYARHFIGRDVNGANITRVPTTADSIKMQEIFSPKIRENNTHNQCM
jgi:hypothetical protein